MLFGNPSRSVRKCDPNLSGPCGWHSARDSNNGLVLLDIGWGRSKTPVKGRIRRRLILLGPTSNLKLRDIYLLTVQQAYNHGPSPSPHAARQWRRLPCP